MTTWGKSGENVGRSATGYERYQATPPILTRGLMGRSALIKASLTRADARSESLHLSQKVRGLNKIIANVNASQSGLGVS
jgi:hypothetical protein